MMVQQKQSLPVQAPVVPGDCEAMLGELCQLVAGARLPEQPHVGNVPHPSAVAVGNGGFRGVKGTRDVLAVRFHACIAPPD